MKVQLTQIFILLFSWSLLQGQHTTNPLQHISSENIGPTVFGGRVVDIEVNPDNPVEFYVAYASGGLWHTTNNGQSLIPIFDKQPVISIGDFAVIWETPRTLIVGTGEVNSSRSSYYGKGIFRSTDNGDSWSFIGLEDIVQKRMGKNSIGFTTNSDQTKIDAKKIAYFSFSTTVLGYF